jgi:trans-aconitate methyltransferase
MLDFIKLFRRDGNLPQTLLDIGCGSCPEGEQFLENGISLTGIDQDGETIETVRQRLRQGRFVTADAACWLQKQEGKYAAILIRRPDVIFRSENWHTVFRLLPKVLRKNGRVVVTTPGESEARLCEKWLRETAGTVNRITAGAAEEGFIMTAEDFKPTITQETPQGSLIQRLSWEDDQPYLVCDLRTGQCTVVSGEGHPKPKRQDEPVF